MPHVELVNRNNFKISAKNGLSAYTQELAESISKQCVNSPMYDVRIHCLGGVILGANKQILAQGSILFRSLFGSICHCSSYLPIIFDVFCPEFSSYAVEKVLELMKTGETVLEEVSKTEIQDLRSVITNLQINVPFLMDKSFCDLDVKVEVVDLESESDEYDGENENLDPNLLELESDEDDCEDDQIVIDGEDDNTNTCLPFVNNKRTIESNEAFVSSHVPEVVDFTNGVNNAMNFVDVTSKKSKKNEKEGSLSLTPFTSPELRLIAPSVPSGPSNAPQGEAVPPEINPKSIFDSKEKMDSIEEADFKCHLCDTNFQEYYKLLIHIGNVHLREELLSKHGKNNDLECNLCGKIFISSIQLVNHLVGPSHWSLEGMIPPKESLKKEENPDESSQESNKYFLRNKSLNKKLILSPEASEQEEEEESDATDTEEQNIKRYFHCTLCAVKRRKKKNLLYHYGSVHYTKEFNRIMLKLMGDKNGKAECRICRRTISRKRSLKVHLITQHDCLRGVVPTGLVRKNLKLTYEEWKKRPASRVNSTASRVASAASHLVPVVLRLSPSASRVASAGSRVPPTASHVAPKAQGNPSDIFQCIHCNSKFSNKTKAVYHYSNVHFKEKLEALNLIEKERCKICKYEGKDRGWVLYHLAFQHECLKEFLPTNLMKSTKGRKRKATD